MGENNIFYRLAPFIQEYIYRNKWEELRGIQIAAAEIIFDTDHNLLLSSGTASGKTEAAFLPVLTQLWENPSASVGVLYLSPLKALINDQFLRLEELLEEADIPVTKWHGDASQSAKKRLVKNPRGVMQTTPESLESLMIRNSSSAYRLFSDLRFVIIDEVHYFMDNDRGLQLLSLLERLSRLIGFHPRRIGLSATLGDCSNAEKWLSMSTGRQCVTPRAEEKGRLLRLSVRFFPIKQKIPNSDSRVLLQNYYNYLYESTRGKRCILFSNSKGEVEENIAHLKQISEKAHGNDCYLVHHANISPALREFAEQRMKSGELPVCTGATVTLELGIDLGHLERIVQTGCPLTVSGLVQRLGRTGRRGGAAEMRFAFRWDMSLPPNVFYKEINWDFVMCTAMILLYTRERWIEPMYLPKLPYSLLYHQTMSIMAASGAVQPRELARQVLTLGVFANISKEDYLLLLRHLLENGHLERDEEGALLIGEKGEATVNNYEFLAVFTVPQEYSVRCNAEEIGTVQTPFPPRAQFALAGQAWEVTELDKTEKRIYVKHINGISANSWEDTGNEYVHTKVMKKILEVLQSDEQYGFLDEAARARLNDIRVMCRIAAGGLGTYQPAAPESTPRIAPNLPAEQHGERIILPLTDTTYAVFPFLGTRGSMALMYALRQRGFKAEVWLSRYIPVCIEVASDMGIEELREALDDIKLNGADKYSFSIPDNCEICGKYNDYIPRELLKKQYIEDYLDTEDMKNCE
ncbi:MAG: DEAD/DEAH box helicase [Oscillospiraceae bacterium]|nr:DEAD/DEAH box helicase [Oscillospiraceae bacterium]